MGKMHKLIEIEENFNKLRIMVRAGHIEKEEINMHYFSELGLSRGEALVLAWLMDHKDRVSSLDGICRDLKFSGGEVTDIMNNLFVKDYVVIIEEDGLMIKVDVSERIPYCILNQEAKMESRRADKRSQLAPFWQHLSDAMSGNANSLFDSLSDGDE